MPKGFGILFPGNVRRWGKFPDTRQGMEEPAIIGGENVNHILYGLPWGEVCREARISGVKGLNFNFINSK